MGRLERKIDQDLVDRILAGWKPKKDEPKRKRREHKAHTKQRVWRIDGSFKGPIKLNRSRHLPPVASYADAKLISRKVAA